MPLSGRFEIPQASNKNDQWDIRHHSQIFKPSVSEKL